MYFELWYFDDKISLYMYILGYLFEIWKIWAYLSIILTNQVLSLSLYSYSCLAILSPFDEKLGGESWPANEKLPSELWETGDVEWSDGRGLASS